MPSFTFIVFLCGCACFVISRAGAHRRQMPAACGGCGKLALSKPAVCEKMVKATKSGSMHTGARKFSIVAITYAASAEICAAAISLRETFGPIAVGMEISHGGKVAGQCFQAFFAALAFSGRPMFECTVMYAPPARWRFFNILLPAPNRRTCASFGPLGLRDDVLPAHHKLALP